MEHVYYTLVGILAMAGICLVLVSLYKLVMFLGDTIDDWWTDRKGRKTGWTPQIDILTPNEVRALQGLSPFHKHCYKVIRARHDRYEFICRKDNCGHIKEISRSYFWDGVTPEQKLRQEILSAMRDYRIEPKYTQASAWRTEDL